MERTASFTVFGEPKAQPRSKARAFAGHAQVYDPGTADEWKNNVKSAAISTGLRVERHEPVAISLEFMFRRPNGHFGKKGLLKSAPLMHTKKPDVDNLFKSTVDALVDCGVLFDDAAVVETTVTKSYCRDNDPPGVFVRIEILTGPKEVLF